MLGYISSTRKKSCHACVKSKRRCDLGFPFCKRCFTKGLNCVYPNGSVHEEEVVVRQATPDLVPLTTDAARESFEVPQDSHNVDPALLHASDSSTSPESTSSDETYLQPLNEAINEAILPQIWEPSIVSQERLVYMIQQLCTFVHSLALSGCTPFIHKALYKDHQPAAYQDSCSLSALYLLKTDRNHPIIKSSIDAKISTLIASSTMSLADHLAAVQALTIYQIIRLFDPDLRLQALAAKQIGLLELWTAQLWKRSFNEPQTFPSPYASWVFYESLRRTVMMSTALRGVWGCVKNGGLCPVVHLLARLPMTQDPELWSLEGQDWDKRARDGQTKGSLVAYGEFTLSWNMSEEVASLPDYERLLLVACRGDELRGWNG
ncbi:hypothetical protein BCR34DRAFT_471164 [Clohesyomyces aquaticus]|uniref:Zn(2)-C6 fungal-type domain-containing protein n=1 Tax=Clohesyomyces aquaticus TaxID=1231657 RepID=A0A1Y2AC21_9PLEO|nr:hypothetical protein BCR34DRAFT_471164 [Clohesyomyces aquaticus]